MKNNRLKIKVCGLRLEQNILDTDSLNISYLGFNFYPNSKRYFFNGGVLPYSIKTKKVGIFVNANKAFIHGIIDSFQLDAIQLHGNETPEFCKEFIQKVTVIKAFGISSNFNFSILKNYSKYIDYLLFDTLTNEWGGSGLSFNHHLLHKYNLSIPFFLSGGIGLDNINEIVKFQHPMLFGVDINSKFETSPAIKNISEIKKFKEIIYENHNNGI